MIPVIAAVLLVCTVGYVLLRLFGGSKADDAKLVLTFTINQIKLKGQFTMVSLTSTQYVLSGELQAVDRRGNPAEVQPGSVHFLSSDESVFQAEQQDNEKQVKVIAVGPGVAELRYSADADLGDGVVTIEGFTGVEVLPAQAIGFSGLSFGDPQEQ